ncbi:MAG: antibiotic biosynthesis monooxygenase [Chloroflexi bacterium]|nr:antibiotic biosynthesis monooxygenase [Chloroflexota bacterium]
MTIVRVWRGYGTADGVERYWQTHFATSVLPQLRSLTGFLDAQVLVRPLADEAEVVVETRWESIDAIRAFAGASYDRAVVEPVVRELLTRFDDHVSHFTVALSTRSRRSPPASRPPSTSR